MFYKFLSTAQALLLTAAMVHVYHLQRQIDNNTIKFQLEEKETLIPAPAPVSAPPTHSPEDYELLPDIQTVQDEILGSINHSSALFGDMREKS